MAAMYAVYHGSKGVYNIAKSIYDKANSLREALHHLGFETSKDAIFDTIEVLNVDIQKLKTYAEEASMNFFYAKNNAYIALHENTFESDVNEILAVFEKYKNQKGALSIRSFEISSSIQRNQALLSHPVFNTYHSETSMMRYLRTLSDRDLALDRTMIPLGSCTMKLNAATEMEAVTWPEFSALHPFSPANQSAGSRRMISELSDWLVAITGYDAVSLQPNAGSQGEFAGLLAIRNYHDSRGDNHRTICLIPSSAHGTNAASAVMAGMQVVVGFGGAGGPVGRCVLLKDRKGGDLSEWPGDFQVREMPVVGGLVEGKAGGDARPTGACPTEETGVKV